MTKIIGKSSSSTPLDNARQAHPISLVVHQAKLFRYGTCCQTHQLLGLGLTRPNNNWICRIPDLTDLSEDVFNNNMC